MVFNLGKKFNMIHVDEEASVFLWLNKSLAYFPFRINLIQLHNYFNK